MPRPATHLNCDTVLPNRIRAAARPPRGRAAAATIAALLVGLLAVSCGSDSPAGPTDDGGGGGTNGPNTATVRLVSWDDQSVAGPAAETPGTVAEVSISITAPDIAAVDRTVTTPSAIVEESFEVALGALRRVLVEALDGGGTVVYRGVKYADLETDAQVVTVAMVTAADTQPPTFTGVDELLAISDTRMQVNWTTATESGTPAPGAAYLAYVATSSGGQDFNSPAAATQPGETSTIISGLAPGATYYVVVRAFDAAGNSDTNTNELALTTFTAGAALYVDVAAGADSPTCGAQGSPCKTITQALANATGDQPIFVAAGTYNEASGETFPLQLKPGIRLVGTGTLLNQGNFVLHTTIENTSPPTLLGADGALVYACGFITDAPTNGGPTIDADGKTLEVSHCVLNGKGGPGSGFKMGDGASVKTSRISGFLRGAWMYGAGASATRCRFTNNETAVAMTGVQQSVTHCGITNNLFAITSCCGAADGLIYHNSITDNTGNGVVLQGADGFEVRYNNIARCGQIGVSVNDQTMVNPVQIIGNVIANNTNEGVRFVVNSATLNSNTIVCNGVVNLLVWLGDNIDARYNRWDNNPPIIDPGKPLDPECTIQGADICYFRDYAGLPEPAYQPTNGTSGCGADVPLMPQP